MPWTRFGIANATKRSSRIVAAATAAAIVWFVAGSYAYLLIAGAAEKWVTFHLFRSVGLPISGPYARVVAEGGDPWAALWEYADPTDWRWQAAVILTPIAMGILALGIWSVQRRASQAIFGDQSFAKKEEQAANGIGRRRLS